MQVSEAVENPNKDRASSSILQFTAKTLVVAIALSASTIFVTSWIIDSLEQSVARAVFAIHEQFRTNPVGGSKFWGTIERELDRAADPSSDLPPEKKKKIINDVSAIIRRWRPLFDAIAAETQKPNPSPNAAN